MRVVERRGYAVPAWACEKNTPLVRALLSAIRSEGGTPSFVYKSGTADLNLVAPVWKCPAVVYGPGDSALDHTPDEHISLEEYEKAVAVLAEALRLARPDDSISNVGAIDCISAAVSTVSTVIPVEPMQQPSLMFNIEKIVLSLHPLFIRPHRKDISHEHNPDTPRKSNPYIITNRLA